MPVDCLLAAPVPVSTYVYGPTRRLPRPTPPALPAGWREEAGMYVTAEGDSIEAELVNDPVAQTYMLRFHARHEALWRWAQQRQALERLVERQESRT